MKHQQGTGHHEFDVVRMGAYGESDIGRFAVPAFHVFFHSEWDAGFYADPHSIRKSAPLRLICAYLSATARDANQEKSSSQRFVVPSKMAGVKHVFSFVMALAAGLLFIVATSNIFGDTAIRTIKAGMSGTALLINGSFDERSSKATNAWRGWKNGFQVVENEGRDGSSAIVCFRKESDGEYGAGQTLPLDRTNTAPIIISGWSRAEDVSGSSDGGYSLYADIVFTDGSTLWGQNARFSCGTHDWEKCEFVILPDKSIRSLTLHCLFRGHTGKVWFDDVSLQEMSIPSGAAMYQGAPVETNPAEIKTVPGEPAKTIESGDLAMTLQGQIITSLTVNRQKVTTVAPGGFLARDFAAKSDFHTFKNGACEELGLKVTAAITGTENHIVVSGQIQDITGKDRALTLVFALPLDATGWTWGDDVRHERHIHGNEEYANTFNLHSGANGKMSYYPLAAVWNQKSGIALGMDMDFPAQYRLVYSSALRQFLIAYDFGLTPETTPGSGQASFRFVIYTFKPQWGFRAALQKYYEIFPQHFTKRVRREGNWMPFTDISKVKGFEDFVFAFQEGAPNVAFDDQHDISSFVYVEPMSHWLPMAPMVPRTYEGALGLLREDLSGKRGATLKQMASATFSSGTHQANGQFAMSFQKAPWCDGAVLYLNPMPGIATNSSYPFSKAGVMTRGIEEAFAKNARVTEKNQPMAGLDGVYLDSMEMAGEELNYRREHFRVTRTPLVFDQQGRCCQLMMFATWEFAQSQANEMHRRSKLMFANSVLWKYSFNAPLLDVLGTEVDWMNRGQYQPSTDTVMNFRRAMCYRKPYCLLMNTDYNAFTTERVERYFQRCLFYGIWPGFFDEEAASKDPYWASTKRWFDRDRGLFKKYMPLLRQTTAAGWNPIPSARTDNKDIHLERFGLDAQKRLFLTICNESEQSQEGIVKVDFQELRLRPVAEAFELVSGSRQVSAQDGWLVKVKPQETQVLMLDFKND